MKKLIFFVMLISTSVYAQLDLDKAKDTFYNIESVEEKEAFFNKMLSENFQNKSIQYNDFQAQLAADWLLKGDIKKFQFYMEKQPTFSAIQLFDISNKLEDWVDNDRYITEIEKISGQLLKELERNPDADSFGRSTILLEINAVANAKLGNVDVANKMIKKSDEKASFRSFAYFRNSRANYLNRYAVILSVSGENQRALDTLTKALKTGTSTAVTDKTFREIYAKVKGDSTGISKIVANLKEQAYQSVYKTVEKDWKNKGMSLPAVLLTDMAGKQINLAKDFKGKIVVIDFWSTTCKPCIAAFPAFERINEFYKKEPFNLFVLNEGETTTEVKRFKAKKDYKLEILFDNNEGYFNGLKAIGTPQKFIIGPDGLIHLTGIGYAGSDDKEFYKVKAMIEFTKKKYGIINK
ncbi:TlpA family protein disulfide reductase [Flavobacterium pectinovorum]|uniref:TlpA family protein disulfide reductase n=1 Tax=Flavobacterium pectinovorum TaxID=29533 RepID=UPI001FAC21E4|nr:TlpA disulfide reductase family protein [Flavobacterium pectinovorum]MCI9846854.1 TlpA family protein disulfide reductase [Flavobacterium pectinovorum]